MITKILYKVDTKGKLRVINFTTNGSKLIISSGLLDGKKVIREVSCKAKNIGRSNETTPEEQAKKELLSRYNKKLDDGYKETIEEAKNSTIVRPMLAKEADLDSLQFICSYCNGNNSNCKECNGEPIVLVQPKLDGVRAMSFPNIKNFKIHFLSRNGKRIPTVENTINYSPLLDKEHYLDGELYCKEFTFQENVSAIKKYNIQTTPKIKYWVYDLYIPNSNLSYVKRYNILKDKLKFSYNCILVPTYTPKNLDELKELHSKFIESGYEGTIIRINKEYQAGKRSKYLLKHKDFIDKKYKVVDIIPADKYPKQGVVICKEAVGKTFKANLKLPHKDREEWLKNKNRYINKEVEVRFFEYTDSGLPRFPICLGLRAD